MVGGEERRLLIPRVGFVFLGQRRLEAVMGDDDVEAGDPACARRIDSRSANRPVHGWLFEADTFGAA